MRRLLAIAAAVAATGLIILLPAASGDDDGPYLVRAVFDNGSFIVPDEEVRIAGAKVGVVKSVDVSRDDEIVSKENGGTAVPGKAVIVLAIEDDGFKDFRSDATCIIRPQSLIGERFVDCTPTQPRAAGTEPPPELEEIPDGEPGEGQRLLPLENNGKAVDIDLINNINRVPYRDRFRIILNDLGAGLAARGDDLGAIIDRANPALRQTDRVLKILAEQSRELASLASNGDAVLEPLARERESITGFFANAATAGEATAERSADLEAGLARFPATLREVRLTMKELKGFTDQGTPLMEDVGASAADFSRATQRLEPFARAGIPALRTLGDAGEEAGPLLVAADPVVVQTRELTKRTGPAAENLQALLDTFSQTKGVQHLMDFIFNTTAATNGFDQLGHFLRAQVQLTSCLDYELVVFSGCEAVFSAFQTTGTGSSASKSEKKRTITGADRIAPAPSPSEPPPPAETPPPLEPPAEDDIPSLEDPEVLPSDPDEVEPPPAAPGDALGEAQAGPMTPKQLRRAAKERRRQMRDAGRFLDFLLGAGS